MATASLRLTGNVIFNNATGNARMQMEQIGFPAYVISTGRLDNARLPLEPSITGNLTPTANILYSLGNATHRWKELYLAGNTLFLGNSVISESSGGGIAINAGSAVALGQTRVLGNLVVEGNLTVLGGNVVEIQTETQITDQLIVTNAGTGPALIVEQTGAQDIATFKDDGNVVVRIHDGGTMSVAGNVLPMANVTYDLGSASMRWRDLYLSGNTVYLGNTVVSSDDSTGTLVVDGSRTVQTVGRTLADAYSSAAARPDLVQAAVEADAANVAVSTWTLQSSAADNSWRGVAWAPELGIFAAVAYTGTGNRVMTSPDGINWTIRTCPDKEWKSIAWSPQLRLFAAVSDDALGGSIMTSSDGINWTLRTVPDADADNVRWNEICWSPELGLFLAISFQYSPRAMRSSNGITWINDDVTGLSESSWHGVTWASTLGLFVAVSQTGDVATSPNGATWTSQNVNAYVWFDVTYSPELGKLVAVGRGLISDGTGARVMTSTNGTSWTLSTSTSAATFQKIWRRVRWAPEIGVFIAIAQSGIDRVMTSPDGENWTIRSTPVNTPWTGLCWSADLGIFVAVSLSGTGNRVMTSANPALRTRIAGATSFVGPATTADGDALVSTRDVRVTYPASTVSSGYSSRSPAKSLFRATTVSAVDVVSTWRAQASAVDNQWVSVCWAPELGIFVAVSTTGAGNRVMTSPDGINWTARTSAADNNWSGVTWAPELGIFVAVASSGTGNRVMTSLDGITWTARTSAADNNWRYVAWAPELGIFVVVAFSGSGNRVMTSPDGITWTLRTSAADNVWVSVTWAPELSLFVAVAESGTGNRVMTSPDGIAWTARDTTGKDNNWHSVVWAPELGIFVAVAMSGSGNRVMTSPDGINWTLRTSAADNEWRGVTWAPELGIFVAVARAGSSNRVMTSPDGINWALRTSAADNGWFAVTWASELGIFVAVADSGSGNRVMTSKSALQIASAGEATFKNTVVVPRLGVGTGTAAPNAPLVIFGGDGTYNAPNFGGSNRGAIHIRSATANYRNAITFSPGLEAGINQDTAQAGIYVDNNQSLGTTMHFATTNLYATGPQARVTISNTGNVGIGALDPNYKLDVVGTARVTGGGIYTVQGAVDGGASRGIRMWDINDSNWGIYMGQSGASLSLAGGTAVAGDGFTTHSIRFRVYGSASHGFVWENHAEGRLMSLRGSDGYLSVAGYVNRIFPSAINYGSYGSIGVAGSTNGWAGISFSDYARTFMVTANDQGFYANNNEWYWRFQRSPTNGFVIGSDSRIKKNIQDIDDGEALQKIRAIEPKTYEYVDTKSRGNVRVYGFIAQQIESVLPHAVVTVKNHAIPDIYAWATKSEDGTISMDDGAGVPVTFDVGETVCMYTVSEEDEEKETWYNQKCTWVSEDKTSFRVEETENATIPTGPVFVSGRQVDDFKMLNKTAIFTVAVAALQEADREIQRLKQDNVAILNRLDALESRLAALEGASSEAPP
jgi:hypothetical protein